MSTVELFGKHTTATVKDGRIDIKCNKGLWSVSSRSHTEAYTEAMRYFCLYYGDGEYDEQGE